MTLTFWLEFLKFYFSHVWFKHISGAQQCAKEVLPLHWLFHCCSLAATLPQCSLLVCSQHPRYANNDEGKSAACWHYLVCSPHILPYLIVPTQTGTCLISRSVDTSELYRKKSWGSNIKMHSCVGTIASQYLVGVIWEGQLPLVIRVKASRWERHVWGWPSNAHMRVHMNVLVLLSLWGLSQEKYISLFLIKPWP